MVVPVLRDNLATVMVSFWADVVVFILFCSYKIHIILLYIDYQDWPGRRRNRPSSTAAAEDIPEETCERSASGASVDEETMHLLESQNILVPRNYLSLGDVIGEGTTYFLNCLI